MHRLPEESTPAKSPRIDCVHGVEFYLLNTPHFQISVVIERIFTLLGEALVVYACPCVGIIANIVKLRRSHLLGINFERLLQWWLHSV